MRVLPLVILSASAALATCAHAQSPINAASRSELSPPALVAPFPAPGTPNSDLAIVFWFDWHDPVGTLRHQVYDRRKREFTPAVHEWLAMVRQEYPDYFTSVRYVDVGGKTVADVVCETVDATRRELEDESAQIRRARQSRVLSELYRSYGRSGMRVRAGPPRARSPHRIGIFGAPGASGAASMAPSTYTFPTPYPYPRPHP